MCVVAQNTEAQGHIHQLLCAAGMCWVLGKEEDGEANSALEEVVAQQGQGQT